MRPFFNVELALDVAMRPCIPVIILFTSLTKEQHTILIIKYCLAGCDIASAFFGTRPYIPKRGKLSKGRNKSPIDR